MSYDEISNSSLFSQAALATTSEDILIGQVLNTGFEVDKNMAAPIIKELKPSIFDLGPDRYTIYDRAKQTYLVALDKEGKVIDLVLLESSPFSYKEAPNPAFAESIEGMKKLRKTYKRTRLFYTFGCLLFIVGVAGLYWYIQNYIL